MLQGKVIWKIVGDIFDSHSWPLLPPSTWDLWSPGLWSEYWVLLWAHTIPSLSLNFVLRGYLYLYYQGIETVSSYSFFSWISCLWSASSFEVCAILIQLQCIYFRSRLSTWKSSHFAYFFPLVPQAVSYVTYWYSCKGTLSEKAN